MSPKINVPYVGNSVPISTNAMNDTKKPVFKYCNDRRCTIWLPIAFGGVPTTVLNAMLALSPTGTIRYSGCCP